MNKLVTIVCLTVVLFSCGSTVTKGNSANSQYLDNSMRDDRLSGGVKMIPIDTAKGTFNVWTKRVGNNPTMKVLLLHGGPGMTHEYFEAFDSYFPEANIEYYYYDQLGSYYSDDPADPSLVNIAHYVEEVEQVRVALGLNKDNFYVLGHSWGGILALEYALKYQQNLKGMVISNMVASIPEYNKYAHNVLMSTMDQDVLKQIQDMEAAKDYTNPKYMELLVPHHYELHVLRMPAAEWPDPVNRAFKHANPDVYVPMQGPSELGASGKLLNWDQTANLSKITVPTLSIGAQHDTMDPKAMQALANQVQNGRYLHCPNGSHMAMYDDQEIYFEGVIKFIKDVDQNQF